MAKTGRRPRLTREVQERVISAIRAGNYASIAASFAGIGESTFYRWMKKGLEAKSGRYREFWLAVTLAEREAEVRAVALLQQEMKGNWRAALAFLERRYPERWCRKERLSVEVEPREALATLLGVSVDEIDEAVESAALSNAGP